MVTATARLCVLTVICGLLATLSSPITILSSILDQTGWDLLEHERMLSCLNQRTLKIPVPMLQRQYYDIRLDIFLSLA